MVNNSLKLDQFIELQVLLVVYQECLYYHFHICYSHFSLLKGVHPKSTMNS